MKEMMLLMLKTVYVLLPAYGANMAPVFNKFFWRKQAWFPMDFGITWRGKRILGSHKTWNGCIAGIVAAMAISYLQFLLARSPWLNVLNVLPYDHWLLIGFLFGSGALAGDAMKSFFKRRLSIKPGERWIPVDQLDFIVGSLIFVSLVFPLPITIMITALLVTFFLHIAVNHIGFFLGMRDTKW